MSSNDNTNIVTEFRFLSLDKKQNPHVVDGMIPLDLSQQQLSTLQAIIRSVVDKSNFNIEKIPALKRFIDKRFKTKSQFIIYEYDTSAEDTDKNPPAEQEKD